MESVITISGGDESELIRLAASLEQGSEHPLASAIVAAAQENKIALASATDFQSHTGLGISGKVNGKTVAAGNEKFFHQLKLPMDALKQKAEDLRRNGQTVIFVAVDGHPAGLIGIADPVKPSTPQALRDLKAAGLRIVMLTGDSRSTAKAVAAKLGIDDFEAADIDAVLACRIPDLAFRPDQQRAYDSGFRTIDSAAQRGFVAGMYDNGRHRLHNLGRSDQTVILALGLRVARTCRPDIHGVTPDPLTGAANTYLRIRGAIGDGALI